MKYLRLVFLLSIFAVGLAENSLGQLSAAATQPPRGPPSAFARPQRIQSKPIPLPWKIAIATGIFLTGAVALGVAARAWRSWNLFDRQYRFPPNEKPALRFGATRSGGCMATIRFSDANPTSDELAPEDR